MIEKWLKYFVDFVKRILGTTATWLKSLSRWPLKSARNLMVAGGFKRCCESSRSSEVDVGQEHWKCTGAALAIGLDKPKIVQLRARGAIR